MGATDTDSAGIAVTIDYAPMTDRNGAAMPDPAVQPAFYEGVLWRRVAAYVIDVVCIGLLMVVAWVPFAMLTLLSFGLLHTPLWFLFGLIPLAYHTLLVSGPRAATLGMRCFDLELRAAGGARPVFLQALAHAALFYLTVGVTCSLILLVALFNRRKRTLHDMATGLVMVRRPW